MKTILRDLLASDPGSSRYQRLHARLLNALDYAEKCQGDIAAVKGIVSIAKDAGTVVKEVASIVGAVAAIAAPLLGEEDLSGDTAGLLDVMPLHEAPEVEAFEAERAGSGR